MTDTEVTGWEDVPRDSAARTLRYLKLKFPRPVDSVEIPVDPALWTEYQDARDALEQAQARFDLLEVQLRTRAGHAKYLLVDGRRAALRVVHDVSGVSFTKDYFRRMPARGDSDDE